MADLSIHRVVATLLPGMPVKEVARRLFDAGATGSETDQTWEIKTDGGRLSIITFYSGFPSDIPVHQLRMGDQFRELDKIYPDAGVVVSAKSASGRPLYFISLPDDGAEMLVELGVRNELLKITLCPSGRFREKAPEHWRAMSEFTERPAAKRAEDLRRGAELAAARERELATQRRLASITDPDQHLDAWAEHTLIWGKAEPWLKRYVEWLRAGNFLRWHDAAAHWNWDYGVAPLRWIATRDDCDRATALAIFFDGEPLDTPETGDVAELLKLIRERWTNDLYSSRGIKFDLPGCIGRMSSDAGLDSVPLSMRVSIEGESAPTIEYADGVPAFLY